MSVAIEFKGDHPLTVDGLTLEGFRRPLGGEVASLTVSVDPDELMPEWLASPPLGLACTVLYNESAVMEGALHSVRVTSQGIDLRIEG